MALFDLLVPTYNARYGINVAILTPLALGQLAEPTLVRFYGVILVKMKGLTLKVLIQANENRISRR